MADRERMRRRVAFLGTPEQKRQVAELAAQAEYGAAFRDLSAPKRAEVIAAWDARLQGGGERFERELKAKLDNADKTIREEYKRDPYGAHYRFAVGAKPLASLNFQNPAQMQVVLAEKVKQQATIRASQEVGTFSAFRPEEAESFRGFLSVAGAEQVAGAFAALRTLDDETLFATLSDKTVADGLRGAMRSTDPAKYTAVMGGVDAIYARGPEQTTELIGKEGWHDLQTWQSNLRYMDPKMLAEERKRAVDPLLAEQRTVSRTKAQTLAREKTAAQIVGDFDQSWGITPGFIARGVTGSQPLAPVDGETINTFMGDYENVFERRFAETCDANTAHAQTVTAMREIGGWRRSEVNGGRLMLRPPESVMPAINGSHGWIKTQIETELRGRLGQQYGQLPGIQGEGFLWEYALVADRKTESEALRYDKTKPVSETNRPPGYVVLVKDNRKTTPQWDVLQDTGATMRISFDPTEEKANADTYFGNRRRREFVRQDLEGKDQPAFGVP